MPRTPRQWRLTPEQEKARREAYEEEPTDVAAAERIGVHPVVFRAWRYSRGLPTKFTRCVKTRRPTPRQQRILDHLKEHPWEGTHAIGAHIREHPVSVHGQIQSLEARNLVDVCLVKRAKRFALAGTPLPDGGMAFARGAASLYHAARLPLRIREILEKEPFLACSTIARRIAGASIATVKSVEGSVLRMAYSGELQRKVIETCRRRMYVYALPGAYLTEGRVRRAQDLVGETTTFGRAATVALEVLRKRPWLTSRELADALKVPQMRVNSTLRTLLERHDAERVRAYEPGKPVTYRYAPKGTPPPAGAAADGGPDPGETTLALIARIVKERPRCTAPEVLGAWRERFPHRPMKLSTVQQRLGELVKIGAATTWTRGGLAHRYEANGAADAYVVRVARDCLAAMENYAQRLRAFGYRAHVDLRPPAWAPSESHVAPPIPPGRRPA